MADRYELRRTPDHDARLRGRAARGDVAARSGDWRSCGSRRSCLRRGGPRSFGSALDR